jgi:hypothetical protein
MKYAAAAFLPFLLVAMPALAQIDCNAGMQPIDTGADSRMSAPEFITKVAAKESALVRAFAGFGYTADISIQTIANDAVDGEFHEVFNVAFDQAGVRTAKPVEAPTITLARLKLSDKDIDTFVNTPPFALTTDMLTEKDAVYSGRQQVAEHNASVFDMLPRNDQAPLRGFIGRSWVWASEDSVLRTCGRSSAFPIAPMRYEIQRTQVAGDNWFPSLIRADEDARIGDDTVHVRVTVKYSDYKAR